MVSSVMPPGAVHLEYHNDSQADSGKNGQETGFTSQACRNLELYFDRIANKVEGGGCGRCGTDITSTSGAE